MGAQSVQLWVLKVCNYGCSKCAIVGAQSVQLWVLKVCNCGCSKCAIVGAQSVQLWVLKVCICDQLARGCQQLTFTLKYFLEPIDISEQHKKKSKDDKRKS